MNDDLIPIIKQIVIAKYPNLDEYHLHGITDLVNYFEELDGIPSDSFRLSFSERLRAIAYSDIKDQLALSLIENKVVMTGHQKKAKNEYERGIFAAISFIEHMIHSLAN